MSASPSRRQLAVVIGAGLAFIASSCSSSPSKDSLSGVKVKPTQNTGLCKLVPPSVVATIIETNLQFPITLRHGNETQCVYRPTVESATSIIIGYDTNANAATFSKDRSTFEHQGQKLGPISGLASEAYYFVDASATNSVTTVVLLQNSLQLFIAGGATVQALENIAHYAVAQYESTHSLSPSAGT